MASRSWLLCHYLQTSKDFFLFYSVTQKWHHLEQYLDKICQFHITPEPSNKTKKQCKIQHIVAFLFVCLKLKKKLFNFAYNKKCTRLELPRTEDQGEGHMKLGEELGRMMYREVERYGVMLRNWPRIGKNEKCQWPIPWHKVRKAMKWWSVEIASCSEWPPPILQWSSPTMVSCAVGAGPQQVYF